jgi:Malectin domain
MSVGETDPGFSFTDASGAVWGYDRYYGSTGASSNVFVGVVKTVDDILFQKQRFGNNLQYSIAPVQPGKYKVTLYMAEMTFLFAGVRVFHIFMEGVLIRDNLDMFALAGRRRSAIFLEQIVNVTDGTLDISFVSVIGIPTVAAIKVERFVQ